MPYVDITLGSKFFKLSLPSLLNKKRNKKWRKSYCLDRFCANIFIKYESNSILASNDFKHSLRRHIYTTLRKNWDIFALLPPFPLIVVISIDVFV